jgi:hypothetical protein
MVLATGACTSVNNSTAKFTIGAENSGGSPTSFFNSDMAWVGIWNGTALIESQRDALYTALMPGGSVASPFPSLQSAVYQAAAGDTILIQPGRYQETVTIAKAFDYVGAATATFGSIPEFFGTNLPTAAGTVGLTNSADNEIGFLDVRGYAAQGVLASSTSHGSLFHHLVVDSCLNGVDFDGAASGDSLINCVIDGASLTSATGFRATTSSAVTVVVENCIFVNTTTALTKATLQTLTEKNNDFYGNTTNYASALNATDLLFPPRFFGLNDYRVNRASRVLNKGLLIHSGVSPFNYLQGAPDMGVWETMSMGLSSGGGKTTFGRDRKVWARTRR